MVAKCKHAKVANRDGNRASLLEDEAKKHKIWVRLKMKPQ